MLPTPHEAAGSCSLLPALTSVSIMLIAKDVTDGLPLEQAAMHAAGSSEGAGPREPSVAGAGLECRVRPGNDGLQAALALCCGFAPLSGADAQPGPQPRSARFGIALRSNLPVELPASSLEVGACCCAPSQLACMHACMPV